MVKVFNNGDVLTAADVNTFVQDATDELAVSAADGWTAYAEHPSGVPAGTPFLLKLGPLVVVNVVAQNTSGAPITIGGPLSVLRGLPKPRGFDRAPLEVHTSIASSIGPVRTDIGAQVEADGRLTVRGTGAVIADLAHFRVCGIYVAV